MTQEKPRDLYSVLFMPAASVLCIHKLDRLRFEAAANLAGDMFSIHTRKFIAVQANIEQLDEAVNIKATSFRGLSPNNIRS